MTTAEHWARARAALAEGRTAAAERAVRLALAAERDEALGNARAIVTMAEAGAGGAEFAALAEGLARWVISDKRGSAAMTDTADTGALSAELEWRAEPETGCSFSDGSPWEGVRVKFRAKGERRWRSVLLEGPPVEAFRAAIHAAAEGRTTAHV